MSFMLFLLYHLTAGTHINVHRKHIYIEWNSTSLVTLTEGGIWCLHCHNNNTSRKSNWIIHREKSTLYHAFSEITKLSLTSCCEISNFESFSITIMCFGLSLLLWSSSKGDFDVEDEFQTICRCDPFKVRRSENIDNLSVLVSHSRD